jgi:hypothetical protein
MAEFLAYRIIQGKLTYKKVPTKLKEQVKQILIESGCEELIVE